MKIDTMDSETQSRPSAMERITVAADVAGAPRAERVMQILGRVLGAPEAAGMAVTIAGENARELQLRTGDRLNESARWLENEITSETNRLGEQMTKLKDGAVATAKGWAEKALKFGLTKATAVEDRVAAVFQIPAVLLEKVAGGFEARAAGAAGELARVAAGQAAAEMNLNEAQTAQLMRILEAQAAKRGEVSAKHEAAAGKIRGRIESAMGTAVELNAKADNVRAGVDKKRVFRGLLARMGA